MDSKTVTVTFDETCFDIAKDTPTCCYSFSAIFLDFNYEIARPGDEIACPTCGTTYKLKSNWQWIKSGKITKE